MVRLLSDYSDSYASNQYRALQQFFKWWAGEEELPDPMARLRPPKVTGNRVPVFTSGPTTDEVGIEDDWRRMAGRRAR
jgi:hypothetical protein